MTTTHPFQQYTLTNLKETISVSLIYNMLHFLVFRSTNLQFPE